MYSMIKINHYIPLNWDQCDFYQHMQSLRDSQVNQIGSLEQTKIKIIQALNWMGFCGAVNFLSGKSFLDGAWTAATTFPIHSFVDHLASQIFLPPGYARLSATVIAEVLSSIVSIKVSSYTGFFPSTTLSKIILITNMGRIGFEYFAEYSETMRIQEKHERYHQSNLFEVSLRGAMNC